METNVTAQLRYIRIAPRKTRLVADTIRNVSANEAEARLITTPNRAAPALLKLLRSAIANAKNNSKLDTEKLYVKEIRVDQGPKLRRWMPRARGGSSRIEKKTSHITIVLGMREAKIPQRFVIAKKEEKKKPEHKKKTEKDLQKHEEQEAKGGAEAQKSKKGIIPKIFRRKAV